MVAESPFKRIGHAVEEVELADGKRVLRGFVGDAEVRHDACDAQRGGCDEEVRELLYLRLVEPDPVHPCVKFDVDRVSFAFGEGSDFRELVRHGHGKDFGFEPVFDEQGEGFGFGI